MPSTWTKSVAARLGSAVGLAAAAYAAYAGITWWRYGRLSPALSKADEDSLLDCFMPVYEVAERHRIDVAAPADLTFSTACDMDLQQSRIIRAIFRSREFILRGEREAKPLPRGLLAQMKALGWVALAEIPGREVVMGAVTQPWAAKVVFRTVPANEFAAFQEPGYVKIVWTLRTDPIGATESIFRTETRVATTDPEARAKFRIYWSFFSPGIILIRRLSLGPLKAEAEIRARVEALALPSSL